MSKLASVVKLYNQLANFQPRFLYDSIFNFVQPRRYFAVMMTYRNK